MPGHSLHIIIRIILCIFNYSPFLVIAFVCESQCYNYQIERHISALSQNHDVFRELNLGNTSMNLDIFYLIEKLWLPYGSNNN